jgi:hypothetical protein
VYASKTADMRQLLPNFGVLRRLPPVFTAWQAPSFVYAPGERYTRNNSKAEQTNETRRQMIKLNKLGKAILIAVSALAIATCVAKADPLIYDTNGNVVGHVRKYGEQPELDDQPQLQDAPSLGDRVIELNQPVQPRSYSVPSPNYYQQQQQAYLENGVRIFRTGWNQMSKQMKMQQSYETPEVVRAVNRVDWVTAAIMYKQWSARVEAYQNAYHRNPPDVVAAMNRVGPPDAESRRALNEECIREGKRPMYRN